MGASRSNRRRFGGGILLDVIPMTREQFHTGEKIMAGNRSYRQQLAREVEDRKKELMRRNRELTDLEAFRQASEEVCTQRPELLAAYRADVQRL
jgi:hypothetical protein